MIPISLSLKGLYSYQEEQTIEFDRLIEGRIFGIFGSVGSGKSSILEAISFALYGKTERLDKNDNRNYNMMNLKSNELLIDFSFHNYDGQQYRYTVKGKRNGKDFEKVTSFDRAAYQWINGAWYPLESTDAQTVIGLSYENFRRTIIIPQGKFQEFLQLGHSDRTKMLKEIFQLNKFEFFHQTKSLESKTNAEYLHLNGIYTTYSDIQEEKISEKELQAGLLEKKLQAARQDFETKTGQLNALETLKNTVESLHSQHLVLAELKNQEADFLALDRQIQDYEYCSRHFKSGLDRQKEMQVSIQELQKKEQELTLGLAQAQADLKALVAPLEKATAAFLQQDAAREKLLDYQQIIRLLQLKSAINTQQERIKNGEIAWKLIGQEKALLEEQRSKLKIEQREKSAEMPQVSALMAIRTWFDQKALLSKQILGTKQDLIQLSSEEKDLYSTYASSWLSLGMGDLALLGSQEQVLAHLVGRQDANQARHTALLDQAEHLKVQLKLSEFTQALKRGEPCPLCGSLSHEFILEVGDVRQALQETQTQIQALKAQADQLVKAEKETQVHAHSLSFLQSRQAHLRQQLSEQQIALESHELAFCWPDQNPNQPEQVNRKLQEASALQNSLQELGKQLDLLEEAIKDKQGKHEHYAQGLNKIKTALQVSITESETLVKQLKQHSLGDLDGFQECELQELHQQLSAKITADKLAYEQLSSQFTALKEQELKSSLLLDGVQQALEKEGKILLGIQETLGIQLEKSQFTTWEQVTTIVNSAFLLDESKVQLTAYTMQVYSTKERIMELNKLAEGKAFDPEGFQTLSLEVRRLKDSISEIHESYISEKSMYDAWLLRFSEKQQLEADLEKILHRAENLKVMRQLFMANGFVNYISTVYLQDLCQAANARFYQLSHQQLRLELGDKNEFLIRDFMNDGKLRSVKTLSGGQTFQASLCLALALAERVQHLNKSSQNFFFLDEGFGSLDKESLQMAFETLKSLRKEHRIVGIISHVEDLQQEIDVYLKVVNDSFSGSKVTKSWLN